MQYFSQKPAPTPGPQLPRPNCSAEALKEKENLAIGIKRKRDVIEQGENACSFFCVCINIYLPVNVRIKVALERCVCLLSGSTCIYKKHKIVTQLCGILKSDWSE